MKTLKMFFLFFTVVFVSNTFAQNYVQNNDSSKWGYYLQIIDTNYIPKIASKDAMGYITLQTGIVDYDAVFAKYKITDFFQWVPTSATDWLRQVYIVICDSGQTQLGLELKEKYSNVIVKVDYYYRNVIPTMSLIDNYYVKHGQKGSVLWIGENDGLSKTIVFFDTSGKEVYSKQSFHDSIDPSNVLAKGIFVYNIITEGSIKRGLYYNSK
ncbi:MAG: hypothetical protein WCK78_19410 [Paludibacter sp.]